MHKKHRVRLERGDHRMHVAWLDITSLQGQKDKDRTNAMTLVTSTRDCTLIQSPVRSKQTATLCDLRLRYPKPKAIDVNRHVAQSYLTMWLEYLEL